jgi:pyruvate,water dikinase
VVPGSASGEGEHARPLEALRHADEASFGGKSASLGELIASGIPVPPGFALSSAAYRAAVEEAGVEETIEAELTSHDPDDVEGLRAASGAIVDALRGASMPEAARAEIVELYRGLAAAAGEAEPPVAVRSSALGEDSAEATFAGQQETFLWVRGADAVCEAVLDCWASLFSPEAMSYRAKRAAAGESPAMGVTVQRMVDAAVSGVMFTCNPLSGDPSSVVVNASWGLGLAVVGGEVTPDEYRVSKVTREVLDRTISAKHVEYVPDPAGSGTLHADVPAARQEVPCLDEEELGHLLDVAGKVEGHFGSHQDVEWAMARDDRELFVLQSRPVTTGPDRGEPKPKQRSAMDMVMGTFGADPAKPDDD